VKSVRFLGLWPRARSYFKRNNWAGKLAVDGVPVLDSPLNNAFAHFVNLSLFFASPRAAESVAAKVESAELYRAHDIESFDTAVVRLKTPDGVEVWLGATHACKETREPEIVISGTRGSIVWRHERDVNLVDEHGEAQRREVSDSFVARHAMLTAVLQRLTDPTALICGPEVAGCHTAVIESIHRVGQVVTVPPEAIRWNGPDAVGSVPVVTGLEAALGRAFEQGSTLAAAGFALTRATAAR
jgi:predicted dehydrogenase